MQRDQNDGRREVAHHEVLDAHGDVHDRHAAHGGQDPRLFVVVRSQSLHHHVEHPARAEGEDAVDEHVGRDRRESVGPEEPPQPYGAVQASESVAVVEVSEREVPSHELRRPVDEEGAFVVRDTASEQGQADADREGSCAEDHEDDQRPVVIRGGGGRFLGLAPRPVAVELLYSTKRAHAVSSSAAIATQLANPNRV